MRKFYVIVSSLLLSHHTIAASNVLISSDDSNDLPDDLPELAMPETSFDGLRVFAEFGYDSTKNDYRFKDKALIRTTQVDLEDKDGNKKQTDIVHSSTNFTQMPNKESAKTRSFVTTFGFGCGGTFDNNIFLGVDFGFFSRFGGNQKSCTHKITLPEVKDAKFSYEIVKDDKTTEKKEVIYSLGSVSIDQSIDLKCQSTMGLSIKFRAGYVPHAKSYMPYIVFGCERFQHSLRSSINITGSTDKHTSGYESFGSFHPLIGVGIEKKLKSNWSIRGELTYNIGVWDSTNKKLNNSIQSAKLSTLSRFKAKGNRFTTRIVISKFI